MAKVSPLVRSFNTGEISHLAEGRTDLDRYPSSCRTMLNYVAAPQGPAIPRSGTEFINTNYDSAAASLLIPFVFSETDFYMIEFANSRIRFFTEDGILVYTKVAMTVTSVTPFKFDSATLGANVGDEVAFTDFPSTYNLNGVVAKITAKVGTVYTVDATHPALALLATAKVARVYHIASPYVTASLSSLKDTPSLDVVYLTHPTIKPYKLERFDTYNWQFVAVAFSDGPYLPINEEKTTFALSATGKASPNMTSNALPTGTAFGSSAAAGTDYYQAFDNPTTNTFWQCDVAQTGYVGVSLAAGQIVDGYSIHSAINNADTNFTSKDYAPSDFYLEGSNDGVTYTVLDRKNTYVLYDNNKSAFFKIPNTTSYTYYRLSILSVTRNGTVKPCVRSLVLRSTTSAVGLTLTASAVTGINNGTGFQTTDVGRLIRVRGDDNVWRSLLITARTSTTVVTVTLLGEPFPNLQPSSQWRLGAWSDTTGYPGCSVFFQDRLWFGGSTSFPDLFAFSNTGDYENMAPTTDQGVVLDTNGFCGRLNARRLSRIKWMAAGKDGVLMGTGSQEYIVKSGGTSSGGKTITPSNATADPSSSRGSSDTPPVPVDLQVLYTQRGGRTIREFAYNYESDGYKSPSMSTLASHLGVSPFVQMAYAAEPFSIVWMRRANGTIVGLTYDRDENVVGWHRHSLPDLTVDGFVESIAVLPASDQLQDILWMQVKRTVNGNTVRYIEKLTKFWDFDLTVNDAWFVDCGLRYSGVPTTEIYGAQHLEGRVVYGLADTLPVGPFTVTDGMVTLDAEASEVVLGIGFDGEGETSSLENGAQDGTAQGKEKRTNTFTLKVWQSYGGEIGTWNEDMNEVEYVDLAEAGVYPLGTPDTLEMVELYDGILGPFTPAPGYEKRGSVFFRRRKETPLPFNITSIMPQMNTQDRG